MIWLCNGNCGANVQGGRQLGLAGCVPVDDSIQVVGTSTPPRQGVSFIQRGGGSVYLAQSLPILISVHTMNLLAIGEKLLALL